MRGREARRHAGGAGRESLTTKVSSTYCTLNVQIGMFHLFKRARETYSRARVTSTSSLTG